MCRVCERSANRERERKRREAEKQQPAQTKACAHQAHQGERLLPASAFHRDSSKKDGLRSYCKRCVSANHRQNRVKRQLGWDTRFKLVFGQADYCFCCRGLLKETGTVAVSQFLALIVRDWVGFWRGERGQPRLDMSPKMVVNVVHYRTLTDEIDWLMAQPDRKAAFGEYEERCRDLRVICGRCWVEWHEAAGVKVSRAKGRKKSFPKVVLTQEEIDEWEEVQRLIDSESRSKG